MKKEQFDENFKNAKPFLLMQFILQASLPKNSKSYEKEFEALADQKLTMKGLETIDQQLNLFDGLVDKDQVEMVMRTLRNEEKSKKIISENKLEIKRLSTTIPQERVAIKFITENKNAELIGLSNKRNLIFRLNEDEFKISPKGTIL